MTREQAIYLLDVAESLYDCAEAIAHDVREDMGLRSDAPARNTLRDVIGRLKLELRTDSVGEN